MKTLGVCGQELHRGHFRNILLLVQTLFVCCCCVQTLYVCCCCVQTLHGPVALKYGCAATSTWTLAIDSLLTVLGVALPVARKHGQ